MGEINFYASYRVVVIGKTGSLRSPVGEFDHHSIGQDNDNHLVSLIRSTVNNKWGGGKGGETIIVSKTCLDRSIHILDH